jgi:phosphopantetheinyl transferase (holo-ACP synthase)
MTLDHSKIQEYESFLNKIPGIISSKIVLNQEGNIVELHILASTARNPKQISRDIQSALLAKYGIPLDHKVISIAQIQDESKICYSNSRLVLKNISISMEDSQIEARVVLTKDDKVFEGVSRGINFTQGRFRALAEATINAIQQFLGSECMFSVIDIQKTTISGKPVCIVAVSQVTEQIENFLVGSSPIEQDDNKAVVKAVLDALNRKLGKYA